MRHNSECWKVMARKTPVTRITEAQESHERDIHVRTVRYLISMAIRMACLLLAVVTPSPWRWGFLVGAVVLPWIAVLIANATRKPHPGLDSAVIDHAPHWALGPDAGEQARRSGGAGTGGNVRGGTGAADPGGHPRGGAGGAGRDGQARGGPDDDDIIDGEIVDDREPDDSEHDDRERGTHG